MRAKSGKKAFGAIEDEVEEEVNTTLKGPAISPINDIIQELPSLIKLFTREINGKDVEVPVELINLIC